MGPARRVKPDEESLLPPPTTVEELFARFDVRFKKLEEEVGELRRDFREEGDPWLGNLIRYLRQVYANCRKTD
jgi:hypothetical protein